MAYGQFCQMIISLKFSVCSLSNSTKEKFQIPLVRIQQIYKTLQSHALFLIPNKDDQQHEIC